MVPLKELLEKFSDHLIENTEYHAECNFEFNFKKKQNILYE
jgi:hypothetical protein